MAIIDEKQIVAMNQHYKRFSLDYFLDCQQRVGYKNIEFWLGASHFFIDANSYEDTGPIKRKFRDHGLQIVSVTTPSMAYQYQYAAPNKELLEKSYNYFINGLHAAYDFGAKIIVINSGWGYLNESNYDMKMRLQEGLYYLLEEAKGLGIICAMETLRNDETNIVNNLEKLKGFYEEMNHPNLKVMIDTIATGAAGESLDDWFKTFGKSVVHMHFLDGNPYVHNIWGEGNTSLQRQLDTLTKYNYDGYLVQEVADEKYFTDPYAADVKNFRVLHRFVR